MILKPREEIKPAIKPPFVLSPSGDFDGNDGKWSTFVINVGDDGTGIGQNFKTLISTSSSLVLVPEQAPWCNNDCAASRGVEVFNSKQPSGFETSSSHGPWNEGGLFNIPLPYWWNGNAGNTSLNGTWGQDNVGLGPTSANSQVLAQQFVVGYTDEALYMGSFGLGRAANDPGNSPKTPFLVNFADPGQENGSLIPSASYGYTAGASYRKHIPSVLTT